MRSATGGCSHNGFVIARSRAIREHILALPYSSVVEQRFERLAAESIDAQKAMEAADTLPFEEFRQRYLSPEQLGVTPLAA
jgi:glutamate--cysteine ligase